MLSWKNLFAPFLYTACTLHFLGSTEAAFAGTRETVTRLFNRVAGYKLPLNDARRAQMETLVSQGKILDAAKIASEDDSFFNLTVAQFAAPLSTRDEDSRSRFSDFTAMFIGVARDNRDARELLYGDFLYVGNSNDPNFSAACSQANCKYSVTNNTPNGLGNSSVNHFASMEAANLNYRKFLVRISPQRPDVTDAAGVLTSIGWADAHFRAGTNRRATEFAFKEFLCTTIQELADTSVPDDRVRQDVDRAPGGLSQTYQTSCRGCHGGMDGLSGAWAYFDATNPIQSGSIQRKYTQNSSVYPAGYVTKDNSWVNYFTKNQGAALGWRGPLSGNGASAFGKMLANSQAFPSCMAKRAFRKMCGRDAGGSDANAVRDLAANFEKNNYNLRSLLEEAAVLPACLGQ